MRFLKQSRSSEHTISLGRLFHTATLRTENECFRMLFVVHSSTSLREFPLVLLSTDSENSEVSNILYIYMRSPLNLLVSWSVIFRAAFLSAGDITLPCLRRRVNRLWTFSILSISPIQTGFQTCTQYSRWGRTYCLYIPVKNSGDREWKFRFIRLISLVAFLQLFRTCS